MSNTRAPLKRQHGYILFEALVPPLYSSVMTTYSLTELLDMTSIACSPLSSCVKFIQMGVARALFISCMVPSNRVVLSPENKPQHALNAKVKYNDRSLSRRSF